MLRDYQKAAVDAFFATAKRDPKTRTLIVAPTASGKSHIIAAIASHTAKFPGYNVLILQHRKELIEQNAGKLTALGCDVAIYSAGLGQKQISKITLAGIQSIYKKADHLPPISLVIVDEVHLLPPTGSGMYQTLLASLVKKNPNLKMVGLTATPFRMKTGSLVEDDGLFKDVCYTISMHELIKQGYLCPVTSKVSRESISTEGIKIRQGEYVLSEAAERFDKTKSLKVIDDICRLAHDRKSILVFCSSVAHAEFFCQLLREQKQSADYIVADTMFREQIIRQFKRREIRWLVNVDTLTTGFDAPDTDCIVMLRPTLSPGLHCQIVGRGMRPAMTKTNCMVLDYAGNIERHGPIDLVEVRKKVKKIDGQYKEQSEVDAAPVKICPQCLSAIHPRKMVCPDCLYQWDVTENHGTKASSETVISEVVTDDFEVQQVEYSKHEKAGKPPSFKISYTVSCFLTIHEFLCFEHGGYAAEKAKSRWKNHAKDPEIIPKTIDEALFYAETDSLKNVSYIRAKKDGKYYTPIAWKYTDRPRISEDSGAKSTGVLANNSADDLW